MAEAAPGSDAAGLMELSAAPALMGHGMGHAESSQFVGHAESSQFVNTEYSYQAAAPMPPAAHSSFAESLMPPPGPSYASTAAQPPATMAQTPSYLLNPVTEPTFAEGGTVHVMATNVQIVPNKPKQPKQH